MTPSEPLLANASNDPDSAPYQPLALPADRHRHRPRFVPRLATHMIRLPEPYDWVVCCVESATDDEAAVLLASGPLSGLHIPCVPVGYVVRRWEVLSCWNPTSPDELVLRAQPRQFCAGGLEEDRADRRARAQALGREVFRPPAHDDAGLALHVQAGPRYSNSPQSLLQLKWFLKLRFSYLPWTDARRDLLQGRTLILGSPSEPSTFHDQAEANAAWIRGYLAAVRGMAADVNRLHGVDREEAVRLVIQDSLYFSGAHAELVLRFSPNAPSPVRDADAPDATAQAVVRADVLDALQAADHPAPADGGPGPTESASAARTTSDTPA